MRSVKKSSNSTRTLLASIASAAGAPLTALELHERTGIDTNLVGALLQHHAKKGRVKLAFNAYGKRTFAWVDTRLAAIENAKRLLQTAGYTVTQGEAP